MTPFIVIGLIFLFLLLVAVIRINDNFQTVINDIKANNLKNELLQKNNTKENGLSNDFKEGGQYTWFVIQLVLFKLYQNNELLDFDSLANSLSKNFSEITSNQEQLKIWNDQYLDYIKKNNPTT